MRRFRSFTLAAVALAAAFGGVPVAASAATPAPTVHRAAFSCTPGYFCIYSDYNGGGARCQWRQASKANTADDCSFIRSNRNVRSLWNGTGHRVQYYTGTNYNHRVGSTPAGHGGNLQGNYQIRSFRPQ
ncbi:peptidase inhibitor family I36 protein [Streptomyces sp. RY43-2]|uniref:Peptidase inhibitor family I36 protein n=1 Tax=Streptomyces macrolidinus TaxID=2952607 RepID=A0ABT0ZC93_9ACTN|nr:peptidase inhibitor family I36 protein [Streptomyces macrolidinus]MCN9241140.1 peptidase inhibitor family I36 protein [Streptomyces macrolidinus]